MVIDCEENDDEKKISAVTLSLKNNLKKLFSKKSVIDDQPEADFPKILNSP